MRITCLAYVAFLTLLLLSPNPARVISSTGRLPPILLTLMPWAHLLSFSVLAAAMLLARWPMPRWVTVLILAMYGGATEIIQGFIPPRTPEWEDWFQDVGGVVVGVTVCSIIAMLLIRYSPRLRPMLNGLPMLRRIGEGAPLPAVTGEQAVVLGGERRKLGGASWRRLVGVAGATAIVLLLFVAATTLVGSGPVGSNGPFLPPADDQLADRQWQQLPADAATPQADETESFLVPPPQE
jgi:hypothetical protein